MISCPTCDKKFDKKGSMRKHHAMAHGETLPNRECKSCGGMFHDNKSTKDYCSTCNPFSKPEGVNIPEDKNWDEMSYNERSYYKNRAKRLKDAESKRKDRREWFNEYKKEVGGCSSCSESHPACIDFHHTEDKKESISTLVWQGYSKNKILDEIENCVPLCANCHRKEHYDK